MRLLTGASLLVLLCACEGAATPVAQAGRDEAARDEAARDEAARDEAAREAPEDTPPELVSPEAPIAATPLDPPSYVERNMDLPDVLACPGRDVCVMEYDFVIWVLKRGWRHHYRLDYGSPTTAIRAGGVPRAEWRARIAAGVGHVFEQEHTRRALGHCSLAGWMPELYEVSEGGIEVSVPVAESPTPQPAPVTPATANEHLRSEYAFINPARAESLFWFSPEEAARMQADTFEHPQIRRVSAFRGQDGVYRELNLFVLFSPESSKVYVLEQSYEVPDDERAAQIAQREADDAAALVRFLQSVGVSSVRFDADAACAIPAALGGNEWMPLRTGTR